MDSKENKDFEQQSMNKNQDNVSQVHGVTSSRKADYNPTMTFYTEEFDQDISNNLISTNAEKKLLINDQEDQPNINLHSKKKKVLVYLIFSLLLGSFVLYFIGEKNKKVTEKTDVKEKRSNVIPVSVKKIEKVNFKIVEKTIGTINNLNILSISSEVAGLVKQVNFDIGDAVKAGDILAIIDSAETKNNLISQESEIKRLSSLLNDAKKTKSRYEKLIKNGFISQADLDAVDTSIASYSEQLADARAVLSNYKIKLSKATIKAEHSGIVQQRYVTSGMLVTVSTKLFDIVNNNNLVVIASLPESFAYKLKKGQVVTLKVTGTDIIMPSKIKDLKPLIDEQSRSISSIIDIPANNYNLKAGGTVEVYIDMEDKTNAIVIPESSVVLRLAGKVVYTINPDNTVNEIPITTGVYQDGKVEILSGLSGHEIVVVDGASFLSDKATINPSAH